MIEKISSNEYVISGNRIADRKFVITKPTENYRVEKFTKRKTSEHEYFGRLLCERNALRYFKTREQAVAFIERQDFN